jgi:hypothetical protein
MKSVFNAADSAEIIERINKLTDKTPAQWGIMNVAQMLAHCNVTYEMAYENKHKKPNMILGFILKAFVKKIVVNDVPYKKSSQTAPAFIMKEQKNFNTEKNRLIEYINKTQQLGENYFEGKESLSFGILTKTEWNNMFYKHLNHHLTQFGV